LFLTDAADVTRLAGGVGRLHETVSIGRSHRVDADPWSAIHYAMDGWLLGLLR